MNLPALLSSCLALWLVVPPLPAETPVEWADQHLREKVKGADPGIAVLVARDGQILFQGGYGLADLENKTPVTVKTKFRIGSVTKQFTAAAILKLAEDGKLAIDDPLAKYFPDVVNAQTITLRHLLTHTSGLHSFTDEPDFLSRVTKPISPAALIAEIQKYPPDFAPGTNFRYCNTAYFLLGEIVAKVSGQMYGEYLRTTFFEPLGMKDTGVYVNAVPPQDAAVGYSFEKGSVKPAVDWDMSWAGGAGALYSTVGDLFRWTEALHAGRVVDAASFKEMTTINPLPPGVDGLSYGFGLVISDVEGLPANWHNGGLHGWSSNLVRLPQQRVTLVALANEMPPLPQFQPASITRDLVKYFLAAEIPKEMAGVEDKTVDPKTYPQFAGRYDYKSAIMTVSVENERLFAQLTGQPKFEIFPKGKDEFFWKVVEARVHFLRNDKGEVEAAQHSQNGLTFKAARLADEAVKLTPEQLDAFIGDYRFGTDALLTVRRDGGQLFARLTGQPEFPIFPTAEDAFEWKVVEAHIHFVKGDDGKVTKAEHTQGGRTFDAPKIK
jgi:CubicO group peptidase (beta-lactamase class C family)